MAELDLGKVTKTDSEINALISAYNGGVRFGKDSDGKPGYIVADPDTGADTVIPFSSGGGGGSLSEIELIDNTYGYWSNSSTTYGFIIGSSSGKTLSKDYKNLIVVGTKFKTKYVNNDYITNVGITSYNSTFTYIPEVISSAGNLTFAGAYASSVYLLNGATSGQTVCLKISLSLSNTTSTDKLYQFSLYGIN